VLLIIGLGNPGKDYALNRHNVGFMAVDAVADQHGFSPARSKFQSDCREGRIGSEKCLILKPNTYMNKSGQAVGEAMRFYKLSPQDVIVFHDELDLAFGKIKAKLGGGTAGHNGLKSIGAHIGPDFHRIRIGISHPGDKTRVHSHVLGDFSKAEQADLDPILHAMAKASDWLAGHDLPRFLTEIAKDLQGPDQKPKGEGEAKSAAPASKATTAEKPAQKEGPMAAMLRSLKGKK